MTKLIKIFSHSDLDGVASPEVFKRMYKLARPYEDVKFDISYCETGSYGTIDDEITHFVSQSYIDKEDGVESNLIGVYIMDLAPTNKFVARDLINFVGDFGLEFACLDHHNTAQWLTDLDKRFIIEVSNQNNKKNSGTSLVFDYFQDNFTIDTFDSFDALMFSELVRSYDTWDWVNNVSDRFKEQAEQWNNLLYIVGRDRFVERISKSIELTFNETEQLLIDLDNEKKDRYIESKLKSAHYDAFYLEDGSRLLFAFVDGEQYHSVLGNQMCLNLKHGADLIDFAVIRNGERLSFRSVKEDIDVSVIAKMFGGGGHSKAAGGKGNINYITPSGSIIGE